MSTTPTYSEKIKSHLVGLSAIVDELHTSFPELGEDDTLYDLLYYVTSAVDNLEEFAKDNAADLDSTIARAAIAHAEGAEKS
jgi:hypothetical protein